MHLAGYISNLDPIALRAKLQESELSLLAFLAYYQTESGPFYTYEVMKALNERGKSIKYKNVHKPIQNLLKYGLIKPYKNIKTRNEVPRKEKKSIAGEELARAKKRRATFYRLSPSGWTYFWAKAADSDRLGKMITKPDGDNLDVTANGLEALWLILIESFKSDPGLRRILQPYFEIRTIILLLDPLDAGPFIYEYLRTSCEYILEGSYGHKYEVAEWRINHEVRSLAFTLLFDFGDSPLPIKAKNTRTPDIDTLPTWNYSNVYEHSVMTHRIKSFNQKVSERERKEIDSKYSFSVHLSYHHRIYSLLAHDKKFMRFFRKIQSEIEQAHNTFEKHSLKTNKDALYAKFAQEVL